MSSITASFFCLTLVFENLFVAPVLGQAVFQAVKKQFQFSGNHPSSGLNVDFMVVSDSEFDQSRFRRGKRQLVDKGREAWLASLEDVILKKLGRFKDGGPEEHLA